jgi:hypothetical protein
MFLAVFFLLSSRPLGTRLEKLTSPRAPLASLLVVCFSSFSLPLFSFSPLRCTNIPGLSCMANGPFPHFPFSPQSPSCSIQLLSDGVTMGYDRMNFQQLRDGAHGIVRFPGHLAGGSSFDLAWMPRLPSLWGAGGEPAPDSREDSKSNSRQKKKKSRDGFRLNFKDCASFAVFLCDWCVCCCCVASVRRVLSARPNTNQTRPCERLCDEHGPSQDPSPESNSQSGTFLFER